MTVVVAMKSGDYLQPQGRQIHFEPGIIMAGDTRLSHIGVVSHPPEDDHVKVDSIGDFSIAGYAGNRNIATSVLSKLEEAVIRIADYDPSSIASLARRMFIDEDLRNHSLRLSYRRVQVLLGIRDLRTKSFILYEMATDNGFRLQPRDGMAAIGSHGHYVKKMFDKVRRIAAQLPGDPFKGPEVTLKENLAPFVWFLLNKVIETAGEVEGTGSFIGGEPHLVVLHSGGVEAMNPDDNVQLRL